MTQSKVIKDYGQWVRAFVPRQNRLKPHAPQDGTMFETYGVELDYVKTQQARHI